MRHECNAFRSQCLRCSRGPYFFATLAEELFCVLDDEGELWIGCRKLDAETACTTYQLLGRLPEVGERARKGDEPTPPPTSTTVARPSAAHGKSGLVSESVDFLLRQTDQVREQPQRKGQLTVDMRRTKNFPSACHTQAKQCQFGPCHHLCLLSLNS